FICVLVSFYFFFFFQAEDGIRDFHVTGVQTCALPIYKLGVTADIFFRREILNQPSIDPMYYMHISAPVYAAEWSDGRVGEGKTRSEERRVGKECRSGWWTYEYK